MTTNTTTAGQKNKKRRCAHCESEISGTCAENGSGLYFCCEGCKSVYYLIRGEGFSSFYNKRAGWQAGPVEKADADPEYFETCVKEISGGFNELTVIISGVRCAACIWLIENSVSKEAGVKNVRMNYASHKAKILFDPKEISLGDVLRKITRLGYCPLPYGAEETASDRERKDYFYRFCTAAFFTMQLMVYSAALYAGYFQGMDESFRTLFRFISLFLAAPVLIYSGLPFFRNSLKALKNRHFTMDTLVAVGSGSAYIYSIAAVFTGAETYFDTSAMIITLILLGRFIETGVKRKNGDAVKKLASLRPLRVKILLSEKDEGTIVPISQLREGDLFELENGDAAAADGTVEKGGADMDESMLTGEPLPVHKEKGAKVFAGTKCLAGKIIVRVSAAGEHTFLSKIAASVEEAQESKAPIQDAANGFIGKFVPFVLCVAAFTFAARLFIGGGFSESLMQAVSVLVIACPCAMGLATPLAVITAASRLSETGIIFKNGKAIELYAKADDFYFDKTGTITEGRMTVERMALSEKNGNELKLISSAVKMSKHPASKAIASLSGEYEKTCGFADIPSKGAEASVNGNAVVVGSFLFMVEKRVMTDGEHITQMEDAEKWKKQGMTVVYAAINGELAGVFGLTDAVRPEAAETVKKLIKKGRRVFVLTGDGEPAAARALERIGVDIPVYAGVSPFKKAEIIKSAPNPEKTAMIGDGINDAIALSSAGIGISMREGTDISIESASAVMLRSDLNIVVKSYEICRKSLKIIKENLFWAFSYNLIAIPLAVTGLIHPVMSAVFMSASSLFVVLNSIRIKRF